MQHLSLRYFMKHYTWVSLVALLVLAINTSCSSPPDDSSVNAEQDSTAMSTISAPRLLWPDGAPDEPETSSIGPEENTTTPDDNLVAGQPLIRLANVTEPTMTVYHPDENPTGTAVVVCPGGGYHILAYDIEGTEVCEWLNSLGITAILLKYRVPAREGLPRYALPLQDAQRAVGLVRAHAEEWQIDPKRIGVLGFSAGGHLSAALSTKVDQRTYDPIDSADQLSSRPDFTLLIYPAYLVDKQDNQLAPELPVSESTPPTLLVQTEDDNVRVENSLFYYLALKNANVPAEMHIYATGGHGYGLRKVKSNVHTWPARAEEWLQTIGMLEAGK